MSKTLDFTEVKQNLSDQALNDKFAQSMGYVFLAVLLCGLGALVAASLSLVFIPFWVDIIISFGLLYVMQSAAHDGDNNRAEKFFYLFAFWTGITLFGSLAAFSILLGPQTVAIVVGASLIASAMIISLSVYFFAVKGNQDLAKKHMSKIYGFALVAIVGLIIFGFLINPANFAAMGIVYGLVGVVLFSALLFFDTFRAAYMQENSQPILNAVTIFLDILNIVIHTLLLVAASKSSSKNDDLGQSISVILTALFGLFLPIVFGVWLVYDYFTNKSSDLPKNREELGSNKERPISSEGINYNEAFNDVKKSVNDRDHTILTTESYVDELNSNENSP